MHGGLLFWPTSCTGYHKTTKGSIGPSSTCVILVCVSVRVCYDRNNINEGAEQTVLTFIGHMSIRDAWGARRLQRFWSSCHTSQDQKSCVASTHWPLTIAEQMLQPVSWSKQLWLAPHQCTSPHQLHSIQFNGLNRMQHFRYPIRHGSRAPTSAADGRVCSKQTETTNFMYDDDEEQRVGLCLGLNSCHNLVYVC